MERISGALSLAEPMTAEVQDQIFKSVERVFKMFFLQQQMEGQLKEFKDDYTV